MTIYFYKTTEMNGPSYVYLPMRSCTILNIANHDKFSFIWSIVATLHPITDSKIGHSTTVSNFRQFFDEINIKIFGFSNGFK